MQAIVDVALHIPSLKVKWTEQQAKILEKQLSDQFTSTKVTIGTAHPVALDLALTADATKDEKVNYENYSTVLNSFDVVVIGNQFPIHAYVPLFRYLRGLSCLDGRGCTVFLAIEVTDREGSFIRYDVIDPIA